MKSKLIPAYSLIELVVVLTILSIISLMNMPNYTLLIKKFRYWDIMQSVHPLKLQVEWCYWQNGSLDDCNDKILKNNPVENKLIDQIEIEYGNIHITPKDENGLSSKDNLILNAHIRKEKIIWKLSGQALVKGYVRSD